VDPDAHRRSVAGYFETTSAYWDEVYSTNDVAGLLLRERSETVGRWASDLRLARGAKALDAGCGAGHVAVALAREGLEVQAVDIVERMVELTQQAARAAGVDAGVATGIADVHELPFADGAFSLAVAVGVLPWSHSPPRAIAELTRVLEPNGYLIVTWDNRARLNALLDPALTPMLRWPRRLFHSVADPLLGRPPRTSVPQRMYSTESIHRVLATQNLRVLRARAVGFGPFTFMRRGVLPSSVGVIVQERLQGLADRGVPPVRATGAYMVVLAQKEPEEKASDSRRSPRP
jgi:ubiquinone/menaquinone biosynthesis C-methylase UbiE